MQFVKLMVYGFVLLSVIYLCLSLYSRSVRRERLEKEYDANPVEGIDRSAFVERGITEYNNSLRPKLLLLVYVVPVVLISVTVYIINTG